MARYLLHLQLRSLQIAGCCRPSPLRCARSSPLGTQARKRQVCLAQGPGRVRIRLARPYSNQELCECGAACQPAAIALRLGWLLWSLACPPVVTGSPGRLLRFLAAVGRHSRTTQAPMKWFRTAVIWHLNLRFVPILTDATKLRCTGTTQEMQLTVPSGAAR